MARPWKHPDSGVYYIRQRIPQDVRAAAHGLQIKFPKEAGGGGIKLGQNAQLVKASLQTKDQQNAKVRHAIAAAHLASFWQSLRDGPTRLNKRQLIALAGDFRRRAVADNGMEGHSIGLSWSRVPRPC
jgi:hypothetical protein